MCSILVLHVGQNVQKPRQCNPVTHPQYYVAVHVCDLHGAKHILRTVTGECARFDRSSERPDMLHESEFEVFPRPAHTVLHAGLLHCCEEFAWRTDQWLMPMARHSTPARSCVFAVHELWNLVPTNGCSSKTKKSHPFNLGKNKPNRNPLFVSLKIHDTPNSLRHIQFVLSSFFNRAVKSFFEMRPLKSLCTVPRSHQQDDS